MVLVEVVAAVVVVVLAVWGYSRYKHNYWSSRGLPTAPKPLPLIGHTLYGLSSKRQAWIYTDELYREHGANNVMGMYNLLKPLLVVGDPELVKKVLVKDFDHFLDRRTFKLTAKDDEIVNELLTMVTGDHWKGIRSVLSPSFTSGRLKNMFPLVDEKVDALVAHIKREIKSDPALRLKKTFGLYALEVISSCAFGMETNTLVDGRSVFSDKVEKMMSINWLDMIKLIIFILFPWILRVLKIRLTKPEMQFFKEVVEETIRKRDEGTRRGDFLDIMMEAREEQRNPTGKTPKYILEHKTVVANSVLFILAGYDTTSTTMSFIAFHLARYKVYQDKLRQELRDIIKEQGTLTYQSVMEAKMLDAVISESLRMNPPAFMTERLCTKDYSFPEPHFTMAAGTVVSIPIWSLHHDPRYWQHPGTFMPERFLPENKDKILSGTYLPFGLGPRNCVGMRFAQMESKLALAKVLLNFEISCVPGEEELKYDPTPGVMRPINDTRLIFSPVV